MLITKVLIFMNSLYALSANGTLYYLYGNILESDYVKIDDIAAEIHNANNENDIAICQKFISEVLNSHGVQLIYMPIKHVFRISER